MLLLMPRLLRSSTGLKGLNCPRLPLRLVNKCHTSGLASIHSLNVPSLPFPSLPNREALLDVRCKCNQTKVSLQHPKCHLQGIRSTRCKVPDSVDQDVLTD